MSLDASNGLIKSLLELIKVIGDVSLLLGALGLSVDVLSGALVLNIFGVTLDLLECTVCLDESRALTTLRVADLSEVGWVPLLNGAGNVGNSLNIGITLAVGACNTAESETSLVTSITLDHGAVGASNTTEAEATLVSRAARLSLLLLLWVSLSLGITLAVRACNTAESESALVSLAARAGLNLAVAALGELTNVLNGTAGLVAVGAGNTTEAEASLVARIWVSLGESIGDGLSGTLHAGAVGASNTAEAESALVSLAAGLSLLLLLWVGIGNWLGNSDGADCTNAEEESGKSGLHIECFGGGGMLLL